MFMIETWLRNEEEERKRAAEEAARNEEEERKRNEYAEVKKKQEETESLRLTGSKKDQQTIDLIDTQGVHDHTDQGHEQDNPDPQEPDVASGSTLGKDSFYGMNLIPLIPTEWEEVLEFSTIFYDKEKKRIVKRTEKKMET